MVYEVARTLTNINIYNNWARMNLHNWRRLFRRRLRDGPAVYYSCRIHVIMVAGRWRNCLCRLRVQFLDTGEVTLAYQNRHNETEKKNPDKERDDREDDHEREQKTPPHVWDCPIFPEGPGAKISDPTLRGPTPGGTLEVKQWGSRSIADLTKFLDVFAFRKQQNNQKQQQTLGFNFYGMSQVQYSIYAHSNFLDVFWSLTTAIEVRLYDDKLATFREFLDKTQYTEDNVASYEWIFGTDFTSPGGVNENRRVLKYFRHLRPGQQMLDIGVGIGGGARQAAREFGLQVLGCDLSSNMIQHAFDRNQRDKDHRVEYQIADAMVYRYEANAFDIVFSRDCIQHIKDTKRLFRNIYTWLKPGGQVLVTMYGKGHGVLSPKFHEYVRKRQYALKTLEEYREIAHSVGLTNIYTENMTKRLREILVIERDRAVENKEEFIQKFSEKLYSKLIEGWADKLQFIDEDNQNWLLLRAEKPVHPHAYLTEAGA